MQIVYRNRQWHVTKRTLAPNNPRLYPPVAIDDLLEIMPDTQQTEWPSRLYDWICHMSGKNFVDIGMYVDAFCVAVRDRNVNMTRLVLSIAFAYADNLSDDNEAVLKICEWARALPPTDDCRVSVSDKSANDKALSSEHA